VPKDEYESATQKFIGLITSDQPEESKHTNFHKAALILLTYKHSNLITKKSDTSSKSVWFEVAPAKATLDTALFKWFAPEVLERYEVPMGKVPDTKYDSWMKGVIT
jgi:hypothetical protein